MSDDFRSKIQKLKLNAVRVKSSGDMKTVVCKDKCDIHMLSDIHDLQQKETFVRRVEMP
jgi:hypothetical protein